MPQTPHDFPGPLQEQEIQFEDQYGALPSKEGAMLYSDGYFFAEDQYGVFNLRSAGGGGGSLHADTHISGGIDEIDGDQLDIDFTPAAYAPDTSPSEVTSTEHLSAHLAGIDAYVDTLGQEKLDIADHRTRRDLIHFIDSGPAGGFASGAYKEILPSGDPFPTSEIWWESAAKTEKIVELTITRDEGQKPTTEVWVMYDEDGSTILETITDSINYDGPFETNRTRTIS